MAIEYGPEVIRCAACTEVADLAYQHTVVYGTSVNVCSSVCIRTLLDVWVPDTYATRFMRHFRRIQGEVIKAYSTFQEATVSLATNISAVGVFF